MPKCSIYQFRSIGLFAAVGLVGCAAIQPPPPAASSSPLEPEHPFVKVEGNDGTVMTGQLMNGSFTIDCGQGELTLLTDHIYSMTFDKDGDSIMSPSVKVFGKLEETELRLKNEHGVFKLLKQNLHSVQFASAPPSATSPSIHYAATTNAPHVQPSAP